MRKVIRLTESDLVRIVKRVIIESEDEVYDEYGDLIGHYDVGSDRLDSARFIPNQKGTEKGHSMGSKTPERSYRKPRRDSGMERLMAKDDFARLRPERMKSRRDDFDLNENDNQDELNDINHIKKQFLLINNFNHLKSNSVDNNYSIDIYGKKYPNFVVFMHLIEIPKNGNNESEHNYLVKFDVKPNGLEYIKYGEEEGIGKKGWLPVKDLYDEEVEKYMKNAANYAKFKYEMDNVPKIRF